jgi:DNA topoisomerase III
MHVLCVAEKPSISKSISQILSSGQCRPVRVHDVGFFIREFHSNTLRQRNTRDKYTKNYDFDYPQTNATFTVTAVRGHVTDSDFPDSHRQWHSCDPFVLFDVPVQHNTKEDCRAIEKNIMDEARRADMLMIWTDCDREGEHIGSEIVKIAQKVKRNITVKRARFSAIIPQYVSSLRQLACC